MLQDGLRDKCSLAEHEIKQITAALDANNDGEVRLVTQAFGVGALRITTMLSMATSAMTHAGWAATLSGLHTATACPRAHLL